MQNKPNFLDNPMNITFYLKKCYTQKPPLSQPPKQTQFKPNRTQLKPNKPNFKPSVSRGWHCQAPACSIAPFQRFAYPLIAGSLQVIISL